MPDYPRRNRICSKFICSAHDGSCRHRPEKSSAIHQFPLPFNVRLGKTERNCEVCSVRRKAAGADQQLTSAGDRDTAKYQKLK
jgi:hypothetical protein